MNYRLLGKTGLKVSCLSLGTVELGLDYGIKKAGKSNRPDSDEAIYLLQRAVDKGINLFDTAPAYGCSEELLGRAVGPRSDCYISTKVSIPALNGKVLDGEKLQRAISSSIDRSLHTLHREILDIVQIHNATEEIIKQGDMADILLKARESGKIRFIGASVYGEEAALTAINVGCFDTVQIAYSLLDQRMAQRVFPAAKKAGVGIINRSSLLKGVLSSRAKWLPMELKTFKEASERIISSFGISWDTLSQSAIRFCLSSEFIHTVLVGAANEQELDSAIKAAFEGLLDMDQLGMAKNFAMYEETLLNPSYWPLP